MHPNIDLGHDDHRSGSYYQIEACDAEALADLLSTLLETFAHSLVAGYLAEHYLPSRLRDIFGGLAEFSCRLRRLTRVIG
ncbi:MAG TPA: hypothetical protein VGR90_06625 [Acidimicrobiales bacterium]|nr:hypothetical protein [Acidimicrobiales bacterium]